MAYNSQTMPRPNAQPTLPSPEILCAYLLGNLHITYAGEPRALPPYRTHGLLAALFLHPQPIQRPRLSGLLFPDVPERTGRRRLSDLLWHLRQSLPDLPLETDAQTVFLSPECRWLDVEAFRQAAQGDHLSDWLSALALYRGDLLTGVYADWLLEEREHLYLQYIRLLHRTCAKLVQEQRFDQALPLTERLVQAEAYDEQALRLLMQTYRALGRRGAALAAYERFFSLVADELGVNPEPATRALAQSLRHAKLPSAAPAVIAIEPDAGPDALWMRAHQALDQGDRVALEACIAQLRLHCSADDSRLSALEIDAALYVQDYARAAQLLDMSNVEGTARMVRVARLAIARHQKAAALNAAAQALALAGDANDQPSELEALLVLAQAQCEMGQGIQSMRSASRALSLARERGSPTSIAAALLVGGGIRMNMGNYEQALTLFHEVCSLAHEHNLRPILAEALYKIGVNQCNQGALTKALETTREALSLWRDLGLYRSEIITSQSLALYHALLGDSAECLRIVERVGEMSEALGDPLRIAINQYHLADTLTYHDEALAPRAVAVAREALAVFQAHDQPAWEASTLTTLSCALWLQGECEEALDTCRRANALHQKLEEIDFLPGVLALEGLILLNLEEPEEALARTRYGLQVVMQGSIISDAIPEIYYAHAMALAAHGEEEQACDYLSRAYQHLVNEAAQHQDEAARQALFHRSPITRRLMKALYAHNIAPAPETHTISRQLPSAHGPVPLQIQWTVDAGSADTALKHAQGAIALRRTRLARLQREAEAQGARPTITQLAEALGVSPRTIKRDLVALRREETDEQD